MSGALPRYATSKADKGPLVVCGGVACAAREIDVDDHGRGFGAGHDLDQSRELPARGDRGRLPAVIRRFVDIDHGDRQRVVRVVPAEGNGAQRPIEVERRLDHEADQRQFPRHPQQRESEGEQDRKRTCANAPAARVGAPQKRDPEAMEAGGHEGPPPCRGAGVIRHASNTSRRRGTASLPNRFQRRKHANGPPRAASI